MNYTGRLPASILLSLLAGGLLFKGGVHPRHMGWLLVLLALLAGTVLFAVHIQGPQTRLSRALVACLSIGLLLQLIALPDGFRGVVSPGTQVILQGAAPVEGGSQDSFWEAALLHDFAVETGEMPDDLVFQTDRGAPQKIGPYPGSMEPYKTQWVVAIWLCAGLIFLMATRLARMGQARFVLWGVFLLCVTEALWGIVNRHGGSLGLFPKQHYLGAATGTLVNANHFATLMLLGLGAGAACFQFNKGRLAHLRNWGLWAGIAFCGVAIVLSQSRAGLMLGCLAFACVHSLVRRNKAIAAKWTVFLLMVAAYIVSFSGTDALVGPEAAMDPSLSGRLGMLSHSLAQWKGFWIAGSGLGSFSWVARLGQETPYLFQFSHLHNDWAQLFVEGGLLIGLPVVYFFSIGSRRLAFRIKEGGYRLEELAIGVSLAAVALHSFVDFPLQIPVILFLAATMAGSLWGMMAPEGGGSRVGRPVNLVLIVALLAIVGLQSAKRDGITAGNLGLLADDSAGLAQIESQLSRERAGAREGIGRLAFVWSVTVAKEKGPSAGLDASVVAAAAARRRTVAQPLDAAAHLAEASSWALATELMRKHNLVGLLQPEEMLASAEQAVSRAFSLEPTNPLVLLEIARIQLQLGRWSPLKKGHYRRAALALTKAIALDPWASSKAYRLSDELGESDFLLLTTSQPQACFENGLAWQRRGDIQRAESQFREALSIDGDFAAAHFSLGTILRARNDPAFDHHFRQFLALGNRHSGMGAWSMLWLGETERAITLFRDLLEDEPDRTWLKSGLEQANLQAKGNLTF